MTDDIVTRLRDKHGQFRMVVGVNNTVVIETIYGEAADEIERLRTLLECPWCIYHHGYFCTKHGELRRD